jgi:hypothetical protein
MPITDIAPIAAAALFFAIVLIATGTARQLTPKSCLLPAAISLAFFAWSVWAAVTEGPLGFWPEHTRNLWGNQIWYDLLIAVGIGWIALLPRLRAAEMNPFAWLIPVAATGCIGFLALYARLLYVEARQESAAL